MNRLSIAVAVLAFLVGAIVGCLLPTHSVAAQERPQEQDWIIQPSKPPANFDAYIFNTRTGEAFLVREASKQPVTLKQ